MKQENSLGIDVSAKEVVVKIKRSGRSYSIASFDNQAIGHRKLIRWATKGGKKARVALEATGVYSFELALALHTNKNTEVMVVNPRALRNFARALMQRAKTDPIDAEVALEFLERMPFRTWQPPRNEVLELQAITRRISQMKMEINREGNRLHASEQRPSVSQAISTDIEVNIRHLQRRVERLEADGMALIRSVPELEQKFKRLISIKGVAQVSAMRILAEIETLPKDMKPNQWVAHAGLDPRPYESGATIHKPRRITKAGNKYLRAALYMPALVAIQRQPNVKAFYEKLIGKGKKPIQAVVAVMRKLLHSIWGILAHDQDFDGEKFYKMA
ncbi:MAG: IS110 family transposase [Arenicellales bacterium]|nr:IS110 family transposase [Arenicellales bacterium]